MVAWHGQWQQGSSITTSLAMPGPGPCTGLQCADMDFAWAAGRQRCLGCWHLKLIKPFGFLKALTWSIYSRQVGNGVMKSGKQGMPGRQAGRQQAWAELR